MKMPNLFIVGQPKSGSTALHQFLGQHPEIYMSNIKAPHFFCKDFHRESDEYHRMKLYFDYRDKESYLQLFAKANSEKILGESSDHYLYSEVAAEEIFQFNPEAKIIIMLREPVSFLGSLHNHFVKVTNEVEEDFTKALALEEYRIKGECISPRIMCPSWAYYSQRITYYEQVKRYYKVFDPDQIKIIIYEEYRKNNARIYREILEFLGVDPEFTPQYDRMNVSKEVRFKQLNHLVNNQIIKNTTKTLFSQEFNDWVREEIVARFLWKEVTKPPAPIEIKQELMQKFKPEVLKISDLIGVNLEKQWGYDRI
ncbi:sulfotransferase [Pleurocapsales cyanobacterium LEGE 06147]|nr:sulfotransferase [Pleurocapsales cyanobacterium LEGE 06147]